MSALAGVIAKARYAAYLAHAIHAHGGCGSGYGGEAAQLWQSLTVAKAGDEPDPDNPFAFDLREADAATAGTLSAVYMHEIGAAQEVGPQGTLRTQAQMEAGLARAEYYREQGLALLSDSARERLTPMMDELRGGLRSMVEGNINPLAAAQAFQRTLALAESAGGISGVQGQYAPYEWARLCRTEAQFAFAAAEEQALTEEYEADWSVVDQYGGRVPIHPNCICGADVVEVGGKWFAILDPAPSACEICMGIADEITAAIGA